jgi:hypothetical protein
VTLYRHLHIKYIVITYNIPYKGPLYFSIPGVGVAGSLLVKVKVSNNYLVSTMLNNSLFTDSRDITK